MRKPMVLVVAAMAVVGASAADPVLNEWKVNAKGNWSTDSNWQLEHVPLGSERAGSAYNDSGEVTVDGEHSVHSFWFYSATNGRWENPNSHFQFLGSGVLNLSSELFIGTSRKITLDGPTIRAAKVQSFQSSHLIVKSGLLDLSGASVTLEHARGGKLQVDGGVTQMGSLYLKADTSRLEVNGGELHVTNSVEANAGSSVTVNGGLLQMEKYVRSRASTNMFTQTGGTVLCGTYEQNFFNPDLAPEGTFRQKGGKFIMYKGNFAPDDRDADKTIHQTTNLTYEIGGELYVTNGPESRVFLCGNGLKLTGGGTIYSSDFWIVQPSCASAANPDRLTLDIGGLYLSKKFDNATTRNHEVYFPRKITFGGFAHPSGGASGDWKVESPNPTTLRFEKGLAFDTTDCFNPEAGRTIILDSAVMSEGGEIEVFGKGKGSVNLRNGKICVLGSIVVRTGATYDLVSCLRTEKIAVEDGATLNVTASNGSFLEVEDESACSVPAGANLTVTIPSDFTSGKRVVYYTPNLTSSLAGRFRIVGNNPKGLTLRIVGGCVYVTDGTVATATGSGWTGAVDNRVSETGNWYNNTIPEGASGVGYLLDTLHETVSNDLDRAWKLVRFSVNKGIPYILTGKPVTVTGGSYLHKNAPFYNPQSTPFYVDADISFSSSTPGAIGNGNSFVLFNRSVTANPWNVIGDVRVSGTYSGKSIRTRHSSEAASTSDLPAQVRPTVLTICRGGVATATAQTADVQRGAYWVMEGGLLTLQSGTWAWHDAQTNRIDGRLVLGAAFGGDVPLYFGGTGEISLTNQALTAANAQSATVVGDLTLSLAEDGPVAADWTVAEGATLTLDPKGHALTLEKTIGGTGTLAFAPNATVAIGGELAETVAAAKRNWTTVAASCANLPKVAGAYQARLADDGSFQVREETGLLLIVR